MAIDFPASPTLNQTFTSGNVNYVWDGTKWTAAVSGGIALDQITEGNTKAEVIDTGSDGRFVVTTEGSERARVDSSGRLLVGTTSSVNDNINGTGYANKVQIESSGTGEGLVVRNTGAASRINIARLASLATNTEVGSLSFSAHVGPTIERARISGFTETSGGTGAYGGSLRFYTAYDGDANQTERMRIDSNGHVTIYKDASNLARLHLNGSSTRLEYSDSSGDLTFYTNSSGRVQVGYTGGFRPVTDNSQALGNSSQRWTAVHAVNGTIQTSDLREKTNVATSSLGIDFIKQLRPVSYKFKVGENVVTKDEDGETDIVTPRPGERTHWGFIAQEVKEVADATGVDFGGWILTDKDDPDSTQGLRYDQFIAPLTKALQEALEKIETLEAKVSALESPTTALEIPVDPSSTDT